MTRADTLAVSLLVLMVVAVGLPGLAGMPLSGHESLTAQMARNMIATGHWKMPYFNGMSYPETPPLPVWLVSLASLWAGHGQVSEGLVRLPNLLAGVVLVLMSFALGRCERNAATGLLAGLMVMTSFGFFQAVHGGQPGLLETLFVFAVLFSYWQARRSRGAWQIFFALLIWLSLILSVLTAGAVPGVLVFAVCLLYDVITERSLRVTWGRFRPVAGLVLAVFLLLILLPRTWLVLPSRSVSPASLSWLSGLESLVPENWLVFISAHPGVQSLVFWFPWWFLIVPALFVSWHKLRSLPGLLFVSLLALFVAEVLGHRIEPGFMLPMLGFASLWLAFGWAEAGSAAADWMKFFFRCQSLLLFALVVVALLQVGLHPGVQGLFFYCACVIVTVVLLCAVVGVFRRRARKAELSRWRRWVLLCVALVVALMQVAIFPQTWNPVRTYRYQLARALTHYGDRPMAVLSPQEPNVFVYYLNRPVTVAETVNALCRWAQKHEGGHPVALFNPARARTVNEVMNMTHPLLQSPGNPGTSVIAAEIAAPRDCSGVRG